MRVSAVSKVRYSWHWLSLFNSRGKSGVFHSFIFKGNQDVGSFNDAYSGTGTKNSIMFMPGITDAQKQVMSHDFYYSYHSQMSDRTPGYPIDHIFFIFILLDSSSTRFPEGSLFSNQA